MEPDASHLRRIFGIETEFGITASTGGKRTLTPDEVARYLFRPVIAWGRSSNVFLPNGSRLYLDVGSHPEYATAECDSIREVVAQDLAGARIVGDLVGDAQDRLAADGVPGTVYLFKNNTDSVGNSYGCHENYLVRRRGDFGSLTAALLPFLITRQLMCGAGKVVSTPSGPRYCLSQRAEHMWDGVSSATTRSRPIINTRDEPHGDAERFRRLHVIVGDSNMSDVTTMLKVGSMDLVLRLLESGAEVADLALENPMRAIRDISRDLSGTAPVVLADGRSVSALAIQREYFAAVTDFVRREGSIDPSHEAVLVLWGRALDAIESGNLAPIERDIDWVIKLRMIESYAARHGLDLGSPRVAQLDLAYHDIDPTRGLYAILARTGRANRFVGDDEVVAAVNHPPSSTRARLRGEFISAARAAGRDVTVDWVHLKINDAAGRTVLCSDPFAFQDERVDELIASLSASSGASRVGRASPPMP